MAKKNTLPRMSAEMDTFRSLDLNSVLKKDASTENQESSRGGEEKNISNEDKIDTEHSTSREDLSTTQTSSVVVNNPKADKLIAKFGQKIKGKLQLSTSMNPEHVRKLNIIAKAFDTTNADVLGNLVNDLYEGHRDLIISEYKKKVDILNI